MESYTELGIVVGVDFSKAGDLALAQALRIGNGHPEGEVHVVHVVTEADLAAAGSGARIERLDQVLADLPARVWHHVDKAAESVDVPLRNMRIWVHVRTGEPVDALLQVLRDYDAHHIVVGTHGRKGLDKLLLGSVAQKLVRVAGCPVTVARPVVRDERERSPRVEAARTDGAFQQRWEPHHYTSTRISSWQPRKSIGIL